MITRIYFCMLLFSIRPYVYLYVDSVVNANQVVSGCDFSPGGNRQLVNIKRPRKFRYTRAKGGSRCSQKQPAPLANCHVNSSECPPE